jgi:hypothetical protein
MLLLTDIRNWIRNIEQHASDNVNKILVGNKADMDESKRVCPFFPLFLFNFFCTFMFSLNWKNGSVMRWKTSGYV